MSTLTPQPLTLEPQTPQEEPRPRTTSDVLLAAARYIEEHGWTRGSYENDQGRVCAVGALQHVSWRRWPNDGELRLYKDALAKLMGVTGTPYGAENWNDDPKRTRKQVLSALREAARSL